MATVTEKPGAIEFELVIPVETPGNYEIYLMCPTKEFIRVHEAGVLDADFGCEANSKQLVGLKLDKGLYPVRITVLTDNSGDCSFEFGWRAITGDDNRGR